MAYKQHVAGASSPDGGINSCNLSLLNNFFPYSFQPMTQPVGLLEPSKTPFLVTHPPEDDHVTEGSHACLSADVSDIASVATLFCLCCLQRSVPYVRLVTCVHAEFLHSMMMPEVCLDLFIYYKKKWNNFKFNDLTLSCTHLLAK